MTVLPVAKYCWVRANSFSFSFQMKVISELATRALGSEPAVFILDNVHLMDEMSWKLLIQASAGKNSAKAVICSSRPQSNTGLDNS